MACKMMGCVCGMWCPKPMEDMPPVGHFLCTAPEASDMVEGTLQWMKGSLPLMRSRRSPNRGCRTWWQRALDSLAKPKASKGRHSLATIKVGRAGI